MKPAQDAPTPRNMRARMLSKPQNQLVTIDGSEYPLSFRLGDGVIGSHTGAPMSVYVVTCGSLKPPRSKVGISSDVDNRLQLLRASSPVSVTLAQVWEVPDFAARWVEKAAHDLLSHRHSHNEWFRVNQWSAIAAVKEAISWLPLLEEFWSNDLCTHPKWKAAVAEFKMRRIEQLPEPPCP